MEYIRAYIAALNSAMDILAEAADASAADLGFKVIVDNKYPGLIYEDQVFQYVHTGDRLKGYISTVRRDGKIDCTLQPTGQP